MESLEIFLAFLVGSSVGALIFIIGTFVAALVRLLTTHNRDMEHKYIPLAQRTECSNCGAKHPFEALTLFQCPFSIFYQEPTAHKR